MSICTRSLTFGNEHQLSKKNKHSESGVATPSKDILSYLNNADHSSMLDEFNLKSNDHGFREPTKDTVHAIHANQKEVGSIPTFSQLIWSEDTHPQISVHKSIRDQETPNGYERISDIV